MFNTLHVAIDDLQDKSDKKINHTLNRKYFIPTCWKGLRIKRSIKRTFIIYRTLDNAMIYTLHIDIGNLQSE